MNTRCILLEDRIDGGAFHSEENLQVFSQAIGIDKASTVYLVLDSVPAGYDSIARESLVLSYWLFPEPYSDGWYTLSRTVQRR